MNQTPKKWPVGIKCTYTEINCIARVYGYCCAEKTSRIKNACNEQNKVKPKK